jgi:hypothetical protein
VTRHDTNASTARQQPTPARAFLAAY